jgi:alpha-ketoglutarate-dependent taurine dioxygenase
MEIERLPGPIGARIEGVDLTGGISDGDWETIAPIWAERHLLVLPDQPHLATGDQVALLDRIGPVIEERMPGELHSFVSNAAGHGTDDMTPGYLEGELTAHMDYTYTPFPAEAISLYAVELPDAGSETRFYSNVAPLERMPPSLRQELEGYSIFCAHDLAQMKPDVRLYLEGRTDRDAPTQSHVWPMVREHPRKPGLMILGCTLQQTERVIELSDETDGDAASRTLLERIYDDYLYVPQNEYIHRWRPGELVVWDNLALQHARSACPTSHGARTFRRVACCAAGNAIQATVEFLELADASAAFSA